MSQQAVVQAIRDRFDTEVAVPQSLAVIHDNRAEPESRVQRWCRFTVQVDDNQQAALGQARYRMVGAATALLFLPLGQTDKAIGDLGDAVVAAFRGQRIADPDIAFTPAPGRIGVAEQDDAWCRITIRIPFRSDYVEP